jgi:hypothetical protein
MPDKDEWARQVAVLWEAADVDSLERRAFRELYIELMRDSECEATRERYWMHKGLMAEIDALGERLRNRT